MGMRQIDTVGVLRWARGSSDQLRDLRGELKVLLYIVHACVYIYI